MEAPDEERQRYLSYIEQLRDAERELEQVQQRAGALRKLVEAYTELYPDLATAPDTTAPPPKEQEEPRRVVVRKKAQRGKGAVEGLMSETDEAFTVGEIMERLTERGTAPATEEALRTTLNRMFKNDKTVEKVEKDGRLAYRWKR